jgi:quinol monooxygenase YgiN
MTRIRTLIVANSFGITGLLSFPAVASDQLVVVVKTFATEGRESELLERSLKQLEFFRKVEPRTTFRLHRSTQTPTTFVWYEIFESQAAYDDHLKVVVPKYRKETTPALPGLMAKPIETESYVELQ